MLIEVERVSEFSWSPFPVVQIQTPVGRTALPWCGPRDVEPGQYRVEWTIDLPIAWGERARPAEAPGAAILAGGHCVILRGRMALTPDGAGVLDLGSSLIVVDFVEPVPQAVVHGSWVQLARPSQAHWPVPVRAVKWSRPLRSRLTNIKSETEPGAVAVDEHASSHLANKASRTIGGRCGHAMLADRTVVLPCEGLAMLNVELLRPVMRASWGPDTCDPHDLEQWRPDNPARGQCGVTALVIQDLLGGDLIVGEVFVGDTKIGHHYWNRLPDGSEVDLTGDQFYSGEVVRGGQVQHRPLDAPRRCRQQYELLRQRVSAALTDRAFLGNQGS